MKFNLKYWYVYIIIIVIWGLLVEFGYFYLSIVYMLCSMWLFDDVEGYLKKYVGLYIVGMLSILFLFYIFDNWLLNIIMIIAAIWIGAANALERVTSNSNNKLKNNKGRRNNASYGKHRSNTDNKGDNYEAFGNSIINDIN